MKVAMLGSGSRGNATLVADGSTRILIDAGFSGRELALRLESLGVAPEALDAIVLTHEHGDHTRGAGVFARRHGTPLHLTEATLAAAPRSMLRGGETTRFYRPGEPFRIGGLEIRPFLTVHDAADPVAVTVVGVECGTRVGVATDLGRPTAAIRHSLEECDFLILESNHCETLLRTGSYPPSVQARIASSHGHLSNHAAAAFVRELLHPRLAGVLLAHLSMECNRAELALGVVGSALRKAGWEGWLGVASQDAPTPLLDIEELRLRNGPAQLSLI